MLTLVTVLSMLVVFVNLSYGVMKFFKKSIRYRLFPKNSVDTAVWFFVGLWSGGATIITHIRISQGFQITEGPYIIATVLCALPVFYVLKLLYHVYKNIEES